MDIKIEGLERLIAKIDDIADINDMKNAMGKACAFVEGEARKNAYSPNGNGDLMRSITSKVDIEGTEIVGTVFTPLEYAPYREFGTGLFAENGDGRKDVPWHYQDDKGEWHSTKGMKPHPFLRPAVTENVDKIRNILKESVHDV